MAVPADSLRERSKAKRQVAIQRAALRLFAERGYDRTTITDIADAVELARRTVTMYFPNKIDIVMSTSNDIAARLSEAFEANPLLSFTEVIGRWLAGEAQVADPDLAALTAAMFKANPSMRAVATTPVALAAETARPALIAELRLPADHPLVAILIAAIGGAINEYVSTISTAGTTGADLHEFIGFLRCVIAAAQPAPR